MRLMAIKSWLVLASLPCVGVVLEVICVGSRWLSP
jgi:hypothetical protein